MRCIFFFFFFSAAGATLSARDGGGLMVRLRLPAAPSATSCAAQTSDGVCRGWKRPNPRSLVKNCRTASFSRGGGLG